MCALSILGSLYQLFQVQLVHLPPRFYQDHATAALIWNYKTREELKEALDAELRAFNVDKELGGKHEISWNHIEFEVSRDVTKVVSLS